MVPDHRTIEPSDYRSVTEKQPLSKDDTMTLKTVVALLNNITQSMIVVSFYYQLH